MRLRLLGLAAIALLAVMPARMAIGLADMPEVIKLSVKRFEYTPNEITLTRGVPVVIEITSEDRIHGFSLPAFGLRADVVPGEVTRLAFTPDKTGLFEYLCDVFCGEGHEEVTGTLIVRG